MEAQGPEGGWAWEADVANGFVEGVWTRIPPPALNLAGDMADLALADEGEEGSRRRRARGGRSIGKRLDQ